MAIQRALISVSDKTGLEEFAKGLHECGVELISTGGTAAFLKGLGLPVIEISDYTGEPELFEGRLKTLHPMVHGGLLHRRDNEEHVRQAKENGITREEIAEVLTQLAFYSGWPKAWAAFRMAKEIWTAD